MGSLGPGSSIPTSPHPAGNPNFAIPPMMRRPRPHPQRLWCSPQDCQHRSRPHIFAPGSGWSPVKLCPPIATAFNRSWMPFGTLRVQAAISFLAELGEQEIIDAESAAKLDLARTEPGDDVPLQEVRRRLGL